MKFPISLALLAAAASASPIQERQIIDIIGSTANGLDGPCKDITFIFARGSTEIGNMGTIAGPPTANLVLREFGADAVAVQGVDYEARLDTNFLPNGADPKGIEDMKEKLASTVTRCPETIIIAGGYRQTPVYSQGAALTHQAVEESDPAVVARIAGIVTFGDTQNEQDGGRVPGYPPEKTKIICALGDLVCEGTLVIMPAHLTYTMDAPEASEFFIQMINNAKSAAPAATPA
ncbi:hypothetical protein FQN52_003338 [Onygenales sp. PD_12]|nr:hypothetical protein FQN53_004677 [Emmonsiellopsis sp. PD_33]KAK2792403.1 hypothetical protein FQN52_003338 [Onygenales sp. PD_12]